MSNSDACDSMPLVAPYVLNELKDVEAANLERHVLTCATCSRALDETRIAVQLVDLMTPAFEQSDLSSASIVDIRSGGLRALAQPSGPSEVPAHPVPTPRRESSRRGSRSSVFLQLVAVAALVLGFVVGRIVPTSVHQVDLHKDRSSVGIALVSVTSKSWGTELTFHLNKIPSTDKIGAWIRTSSSGKSRQVICWWPLHRGEQAGTFLASTEVPRSSITALGIFTGSQRALWWIPGTSI